MIESQKTFGVSTRATTKLNHEHKLETVVSKNLFNRENRARALRRWSDARGYSQTGTHGVTLRTYQVATNFGKFWAVGVGPGDPELLTLKAVNVIRQADVVYHAGPQRDQGRAWDIIQHLVRPNQEVRLMLAGPMAVVTAADHRTAYRQGVDRAAADCHDGLNVVFVAEGDPSVYSTASPVWQLLAELHPDLAIEIVPGISSITAAAARVYWPLAQKDEMFAVMPANYRRAEIKKVLDTFPTVCFLKVPQALPELLGMLGPNREAVYVENLGTAHEWISHDLNAAADRKNYFSLVLVRNKEHQRAGGAGPPSDSNFVLSGVTQGAYAPRSGEGARGKVWVVGLGPGDPGLLTAQALATLQAADAIVGYEGYLQGLAPLGLQAEMHGTRIGAESERARLALDLARAGRRVAVVSSGDAGVYGMAGLVLETTETIPGVAVEVVPGVTAALAAASLLGAPLGHDFACVSLSDLLTSWEVIEHRLHAVGRGDLVVALYNPASRRRTWQLPRAVEILLEYRPADTPVGLVDRAYRPRMQVWQTTLGELAGDGVGMETILIVGSSRTRVVNGRMVTPRGYGKNTTGEHSAAQVDGHRVGRDIMDESFAIIERELGPLSLPPWAFAVVRRMIHASADFDFAASLRYSPSFEEAIRAAFRPGPVVVADTEMVRVGIRSVLTAAGAVPVCHLNDALTTDLAEQAGLTRCAAGIRLAARRHPGPIVVIGNAPTALEEALRLVEDEDWRPAAIIAMPVGFVGVEEAKRRLLAQSRVPYLTCVGRKGGSAVTAAALNAVVEWLRNQKTAFM